MSNSVQNMSESALNQIKQMVNTDAIIGNPINVEGGAVIIPVSKVSYGFASGGSDFTSSKCADKELFGGGNGAGVNITPIAFLVINNGDIKLLQVESFSGAIDRVIAMAPDVIDKIGKFIKKKKEDKEKSKGQDKQKQDE